MRNDFMEMKVWLSDFSSTTHYRVFDDPVGAVGMSMLDRVDQGFVYVRVGRHFDEGR
jgi:hypothetical protein